MARVLIAQTRKTKVLKLSFVFVAAVSAVVAGVPAQACPVEEGSRVTVIHVADDGALEATSRRGSVDALCGEQAVKLRAEGGRWLCVNAGGRADVEVDLAAYAVDEGMSVWAGSVVGVIPGADEGILTSPGTCDGDAGAWFDAWGAYRDLTACQRSADRLVLNPSWGE